MKRMNSTFAAALGLIAVATVGLTACSAGAGNTGSESMAPSPSVAPSSASAAPSGSAMASEAAMDPAANLVGAGCAAYAKAVPSGDGSVAGMAQDPVAVAASNNPLLKTLTAAVSAGMVDGAKSDGMVMVSGAMEGVTHFGITVEPASGSPAPTTDPILVQAL